MTFSDLRHVRTSMSAARAVAAPPRTTAAASGGSSNSSGDDDEDTGPISVWGQIAFVLLIAGFVSTALAVAMMVARSNWALGNPTASSVLALFRASWLPSPVLVLGAGSPLMLVALLCFLIGEWRDTPHPWEKRKRE